MYTATDNPPATYLLGSIFASALYSIYVLAFSASIYFLSNVRGRRVKPNKILLTVSVILFVCVTAHWCMGIAYIYTAFVTHGDTANGALKFFGGLTTPEVARFYVFAVILAILDGVLAYRMYIVWGRSWSLVILPCACIAVYMSLATVLLQTSVQVSQAINNPSHYSDAILKAEGLKPEIIVAFSLSIVANFFCTGMIIVKILRNGRAVKRAGARSFTRPAFHLLLESAAICCVCLIITPVLIVLKNCGTNLMLEVTPMIFGLSYSAIIIRVGLGIAERGSNDPSLSDVRFSISSWRFTGQPHAHAQASALAISVDQEVSISGDGRSGSGGGASDPSGDPEIALELVDDLSANIHGDKLGRPWEAPPWHPRPPARSRTP